MIMITLRKQEKYSLFNSGEFDIENVNATKVECNGLLGSAGDDTKVNRDCYNALFNLFI